MRARSILLALSFVALVARIALSDVHSHRNDLAVFADWAVQLRSTPPWEFHSFAGYPPGYFVVMLVVGRIDGLLAAHGADPDGLMLRVLLKLPSIIMDVVNAWFVYGIARIVAPRLALVAGIGWLFNPVALLDSTFWGQLDAVNLGFALAAMLCALMAAREPDASARWFAWAWILLGVSLLIKPTEITLVPVLGLYALLARAGTLRARVIGSAVGMAGALAITCAVCSLFTGIANPISALSWLYREITVHSMIGAAGAYTTLNAYNIWAVVLPFYLSDGITLVGLSLHTWGELAAGVLILTIMVRFVRLRDERAFVECTMLVTFALFLCATRMHERYVDGAVMLAVALIGLGRTYLACAIAFTITTSLNMLYGLRFEEFYAVTPPYALLPGVPIRDFWPWISHPASFANVALFAVLLWTYLRPRAIAEVREPSPRWAPSRA